jgi:predicted N-acetyltransferase YhbS
MRALPDGLTLRDATPADRDQIVELNASVFDRYEATAIRHLFEGEGYGPGDWTVVEDADGRLVSACTRFDHVLRFGSTEVPAAQIEFVATRPEHRKQGLVRALFEVHHQRAEAAGALAIVVTGIPYLYRRLGYGYAFDELRQFKLVTPPEAPDGWDVSDAGEADVDRVTELIDRAQDRCDIALRNSRERWAWLVGGAATWDEHVRVVRRDGRIEGLARTQVRPDEGYWASSGTATSRDAARALLADAAVSGGDLQPYVFERHDDPWGTVVRECGTHEPATFNAIYGRIPDPAAFLDHLRPELSARLAASPLRNESGELRLSLYSDGVILTFDNGEVIAVRRDPEPELDPLDDDGAGVAPDAFPALVFGRFTAEELQVRYDDVGYLKDRALMGVLFPKQVVDLSAPV